MFLLNLGKTVIMNTIQYEKEDVLALITKGVNAGVWDWNIVTGKAWWSDSYYQLLGYEDGEIEPSFGTFVDGLVHEEDRDAIQMAISNHLEYNIPYELEIRLRTKSDGYKWFETSGSAKRDENGNTVRMSGVIINRHDKISMRRKLELSEFLLNETGRLANIAGWELNLATQEFFLTKAGYQLYGHDENMPISEQDRQNMFTPEEWKERNEKLQEIIATGKEYESVNQITLRDGTKKWIYNKVIPIFGNEGEVAFLRGITQDITSQKNREEELGKTYATIEEQNKRLLNFAHIVTHNLRAHSGNLVKVTEILENADSDIERMEMIGYVKRLGQSLYETINNLNEIVQIQTNNTLKKEVLQFDKVYSKIISVVQADLKENGVTILTDFSACPEIESVPSYLESILLNFTTNAIKYRHPDRRAFIKILTSVEDGRKTLTVEDNGLGIDLERYGSKLFGMYKTFHSNPDARGVGLFITKNQIDALGGEIKVLSEPNVGTTFKILF